MIDVSGELREHLQGKILKYDERSESRIYVDCSPQDIPEAVRFLFFDLGLRFVTATGLDTPSGIELLYHFSHDESGKVVSLRTKLSDRKNPEIETIATIFPGAEWIEREIWELLGVNFKGHPNLKHLLLIDDWPEGKFPLRKK